MTRFRTVSVFAVAIGGACWWSLGDPFGAASAQGPGPRRTPPKVSCLEEPKHWSDTLDLAGGNQIIVSRYIRFDTPDGRSIPARVFVLERPDDAGPPARPNPGGWACLGHEIAVDDDFEPDFRIPAKYVKGAGCTFMVRLGAVEFLVRTTDPNAKK